LCDSLEDLYAIRPWKLLYRQEGRLWSRADGEMNFFVIFNVVVVEAIIREI
jgi:hypothetical protein